jgi:hypothetical protein
MPSPETDPPPLPPDALRLIVAAIALHGILTSRDVADVAAESHANIARDALGLADALIAQAGG